MTASFRLVTIVVGTIALIGCRSAADHREDVSDTSGEQLTVGTVQRGIDVGMSGAQVAEVLGSPNVVTTDEFRREVWIYDKISTQVAFSNSSGSASSSVAGIPFISGGLVGGSGRSEVSGSSGAQETQQRTLTVVIKFDEDGLVRDYAYQTSRF